MIPDLEKHFLYNIDLDEFRDWLKGGVKIAGSE